MEKTGKGKKKRHNTAQYVMGFNWVFGFKSGLKG